MCVLILHAHTQRIEFTQFSATTNTFIFVVADSRANAVEQNLIDPPDYHRGSFLVSVFIPVIYVVFFMSYWRSISRRHSSNITSVFTELIDACDEFVHLHVRLMMSGDDGGESGDGGDSDDGDDSDYGS